MKERYKSEAYEFKKYVKTDGWISYYNQIKFVLDSDIKSILVIGKGDGVVPNLLKEYIEVETFDIEETLKPDYLGDILELDKIIKKKYDAILCCEVLEHLPFKEFENCLIQIEKRIKNKVILSLPQQKLGIKIKIKVPKIPELKSYVSIFRFWRSKSKIFAGHFWEIGIKGYPLKRIEEKLEKYFEIEKQFVDIENTYHRFFILNKKNKGEN